VADVPWEIVPGVSAFAAARLSSGPSLRRIRGDDRSHRWRPGSGALPRAGRDAGMAPLQRHPPTVPGRSDARLAPSP
jgi:hypothetical protein